jgi:hypothetical protein
MTFPANRLEAALAGLRGGSISAERVLGVLAAEPLWVPLPGGARADGMAQLPVMMIEGGPHVAVYTSEEQFGRGAGAGTAHMVLTGRELAGLMAAELGLAVNPGAELGLPVRPDGVHALRDAPLQNRTKVRLGEPAEEPRDLLAAIAEGLRAIPTVREARRALAQFGEQPPVLLIGLRTTGTPEEAVAVVRESAKRARCPYPVEVVLLTTEGDPITAWMNAKTRPFHRA